MSAGSCKLKSTHERGKRAMLIVVEQEEDNRTADISGVCVGTKYIVPLQVARYTKGRDYHEEEEHYIIINDMFARLAHGYKRD